jgi:hypothetical protein
MPIRLEADQDTVIVLLKGGRLPQWQDVPPDTRRAYEQEHVDLMLETAHRHRLLRLEGFKLLLPQHNWKTFWITEFPTLAGAEAWIDAEMRPPYGRYGFLEYYVAHQWAPDYFASWVTAPPSPVSVPAGADPHHIPALGVERESYVSILFGRSLPEMHDLTPPELDDAQNQHIALMQSVAAQHGLMRLEGFKLVGPQADWHRAWIIELPTMEGIEAWIEAEVAPPLGRYGTKAYYLARKWSPAYFQTWVSQG